MTCWGKCWKHSDINRYKLACTKKTYNNCLELLLRILLAVNIKYVSECTSALSDVAVYTSWHPVVCATHGDLMSVYMKVNTTWLCTSCCFSEESLESEITNVRPLKCPHGPILTNVTLRHELRAGKFSRLGLAANMDTCIQMCCEKDDCEMAFMPGKHCYGVDCFSQKHCEITTVKPGNLTVKIAAVRPIAVNPTKDQIAGVLNIHRSVWEMNR